MFGVGPRNSNGLQEFSIEIPDKEADAIHSGMFTSGAVPGTDKLTI